MKNTAPREDFTDADIKIGKRATWAVGLPAIEHAMIPSEEEMGTARTAKVSLTTPRARLRHRQQHERRRARRGQGHDVDGRQSRRRGL